MGLTVKLILPLFGAVMLCGYVMGVTIGYDDVNSLPPAEKRRIIRELLRAQKDIRRALLKVHYSLNGEEFESDDEEESLWAHGCWDKELPGFRQNLEDKMASLSSGLTLAHQMMDEIDERIKPGHHGHYESGYGGGGGNYGGDGDYGGGYGEYGHQGYGPGYGNGYGPMKPRPTKTTRPPLTTTPETTSWRPTTESYETEDEDEYYARNRHVGANRRYGRVLSVDAAEGKELPVNDAPVPVEVKQPENDSEVAAALETLAEDTQA